MISSPRFRGLEAMGHHVWQYGSKSKFDKRRNRLVKSVILSIIDENEKSRFSLTDI